MKRITISLDLKDNEVLEKEVLEAIRDTAKQIAREEINKVMLEEIQRIVTKEIKDINSSSRWASNSRLELMAKDEVNRIVKEAIGEVTIPSNAVEDRLAKVLLRVDDKVDCIVQERLKKVDLEGYVESKVRQEVKAKVPDALLDIIVNGMQSRGLQNDSNKE